ncbi:MAG: hypothetical protein L0Z62_09470, partial [Gemmataceae bacterium]|nr:hypothetical protein [Gemmataceae bacterium]
VLFRSNIATHEFLLDVSLLGNMSVQHGGVSMRKPLKPALFVGLCLFAAWFPSRLPAPLWAGHECRNWTCQGTVPGVIKNTQIQTQCTLNPAHVIQACFEKSGSNCDYRTTTFGLCPGTVPAGQPLAGSPCEAKWNWCVDPVPGQGTEEPPPEGP